MLPAACSRSRIPVRSSRRRTRDAWRLVPLLSRRSNDPLILRGLTGELSLTADGRVIRYPALALIENGHNRMGETIHIPMPDEIIKAEICSPVFYDPQGGKVNG